MTTGNDSEPSEESLGAALLAAKRVSWPWWARLLPRSERQELACRFARVMAPAVEVSIQRRGTESAEAADA